MQSITSDERRGTSLEVLPSETLLAVATHLDTRSIARLRGVSRYLKTTFSSDSIWKQRCQDILAKGPPIDSVNIVGLHDPVEPWSTAFDPTSELHDPFDSSFAFEWPVKPAWQGYSGDNRTVSGAPYSIVEGIPPLSSFPGASGYYDVFRSFVYPFGRLLGWWLSDSPYFGMAIRIVFASGANEDDETKRPAISDCIPADHSTPRREASQPTFFCQKIHVLDRLRPSRYHDDYSVDWCRVLGFNPKMYRHTAQGREALRSIDERIDLLYPGIQTEPLWQMTWQQAATALPNPAKPSARQQLEVATRWKGWERSPHVIPLRDLRFEASMHDDWSPSLLAQARALFATSRTNYMPDEERLFRFLQMSMAGRHPLLPHLRARHANALQVESESHVHNVWLTSGAASSTSKAKARHDESTDEYASLRASTTISLEHVQPYFDSDYGLGYELPSHGPAPAICFPPPALLPLARGVSDEDGSEQHSLFDEFIEKERNVRVPVLSMDPSPPYKLMPHFMNPQSSGPRFFPIRSPSALPHGLLPTCVVSAFQRMSREELLEQHQMQLDRSRRDWRPSYSVDQDPQYTPSVIYRHPQRIDPRIDPGSESFDWTCLEGLFAMSYGPWGQEILYLRSRELTVHDFGPSEPVLEETRWSSQERNLFHRPPTGPHGTGHQIDAQTGTIEEGNRWPAEPFVSRISPRDGSLLPFVRPGCRVLEAIKCTGDANVPRGAVTFRAFSRGQAADPRKEYTAPDPEVAGHGPWLGEVDPTLPWGIDGPRPGRVLQHATGRLAPHLFVGGGNFRSCTIFVASPDEVYVCWHDLGKIAVAKRFTAC